MAACCTDPLVSYGKAGSGAVPGQRGGRCSGQQVALCIIVSTGIVSNFTTTASDYYYNSSLAHCVYYGARVAP